MRKVINFVEGPILQASSQAMALVYRKFGISPRRQVPGWEMIVSGIETITVLSISAFLFRYGERQLSFLLPFISFSAFVDTIVSFKKMTRVPVNYDAKAYRTVLTEAHDNRMGSVYLRGLSLFIPLLSLVIVLMPKPAIYLIAAWGAFIYFSLYVSKFYVRAAEPPHPDEGDTFAAPAFG
jgi:hypothetical protein